MNEGSNALRPIRLGLSLGTFLLVAYLACLALAFVVPDPSQHWLRGLPGFTWTLQGIVLGLVEVFAYGFVSGIVFASIYIGSTFEAVDRMRWVTAPSFAS